MTLSLARLKKAWTLLTAPDMECALCACGSRFWRVRRPHPDTQCADCRDRQMDAWITNYEARQAHAGQSVRRIG